MAGVFDKVTGQTFASRQEFDKLRRTQEWQIAKRKQVKEWSNVYECYFCKANGKNVKFVSVGELRSHVLAIHTTETTKLQKAYLGVE